ncbi:hypothetical protein ABVB72_04470 [Rhizobium nepotum]|uniref:hypothetical protein n=1 Tax=Rhizobium nepotum TaxID=1035271 RepID=UPI00336A402A
MLLPAGRAKAPAWFQEIAANPGQAAKPKGVVADEAFKGNDPLGLYAGQPNPFEQDAASAAEAKRTAEAQATAETERQRVAGEVSANNDAVAGQLAGLEEKNPGRYQEVPESQLATWQEQWDSCIDGLVVENAAPSAPAGTPPTRPAMPKRSGVPVAPLLKTRPNPPPPVVIAFVAIRINDPCPANILSMAE